MNFLDIYFQSLKNLIRVKSKDKRIIVLKGVPISIVEKLSDMFISNLHINNGLIDIDKIKATSKELIKEVIFSKAEGVILYEQLYYISESVNPQLFSDELIVIEDNIRTLFPNQCILQFSEPINEEIEVRSENLPGFYAEIIDIKGKLFYKYTSTPLEFSTIGLFNESLKLIETSETGHSVIDLELDSNSIDIFLAENLIESSKVPIIYIKKAEKNQLFKYHLNKLEKINYLLNQFGGKLFLQLTEPIKHIHLVSHEVDTLLHKYWGENSSFRSLKVYKNPDVSKEVVDISQGDVVQCVINEYNNTRQGKSFRDIFLTAPTGAGKSLLFQLPAFYISEKGGMSIVVSPLIALMKDQVTAIIQDRNFHKVAYVNSELNLIDREKTIEACKLGEIDVLYLSPELLLSYDISYFVGTRTLGLMIIDEAHLVTTWGRDFRVDYWFLGTHLRKVRKYSGHKFPIIAVTATAVYGGSNDMVFDCIDSLYLVDPHKFIGKIIREDIKFLIGREEVPNSGFERHKYKQTVSFIKRIAKDTSLKTLVYAPYTKHVKQIYDDLPDEVKEETAKYFGTLDQDSKSNSYLEFLSNEKRIMICTKAFGMGVDISDIIIAYHHAPSGQLSDYVQEIGRIAREKNLTGYAVINFSEKDLWFSKLLHGMSAIKKWEIKDVLRKLNKLYQRELTQNLLISVDDFAHIFQNPQDLDQKVMTALMMIEKDYLIKSRFNVIIARPKKLFTRVYGRMTNSNFKKFQEIFKETSVKLLEQISTSDNVIAEINLDSIWKNYFKDMSFPILKAKYFKNELFNQYNIVIAPQLKISFVLEESFDESYNKIDSILTTIQSAFTKMDGFFTEEDLLEKLSKHRRDEELVKKLVRHFLSVYSSVQEGMTRLYDPNSFLQKRRNGDKLMYRVFGSKFASEFLSLKRYFENLFTNGMTDNTKISKFITKDSHSGVLAVRLGYLLEICEIGSFELSGGESPMIFLRINDPRKLAYDATHGDGSNILLEDVHRRHRLSNEIFNHFFLRDFSDFERWQFIEDYFLGKEIDDLLSDYPGEQTNNENLSVFEKLKSVVATNELLPKKKEIKTGSLINFPPNPNQVYWGDNLLTINVNGKDITKTINSWLKKEAVLLDKICCEHKLDIATPIKVIMHSKLKKDKDYYASKMGLKLRIQICENGPFLPAISHFENEPIKFYNWWKKNTEKLVLHNKDLIVCLLKVYDLDHSMLLPEHRKLLKEKGLI